MKKFFKVFALVAVMTLGVAAVSAFTEPKEPEVTISLYGFENPMYMSLNSCAAIYRLLPDDIQRACKMAYNDVIRLGDNSSMNYAGVSVSHKDGAWTFKYRSNKMTVNATADQLNDFFYGRSDV